MEVEIEVGGDRGGWRTRPRPYSTSESVRNLEAKDRGRLFSKGFTTQYKRTTGREAYLIRMLIMNHVTDSSLGHPIQQATISLTQDSHHQMERHGAQIFGVSTFEQSRLVVS